MATDDLTPFLIPPPSGQGVRYGQGKLVAWNPTTFANEVSWRGTVLRNLPVLAGPSALTFAPGQIVALIGWAPGGGAGSWAILGQWVTPGSGVAEQQVQFLQTSLASAIVDELVEQLLISPAGQELAAFVFAQRVHFDEIDASVNTTSATYTSLTGGPAVSDVPISDSGIAIVGVQARIPVTADPTANRIAYMSYAVSGATTQAADDIRAKVTSCQDTDTSFITSSSDQSMSWSIASGLNPGLHTFTAQYRRVATGFTANFSARRIIVMAL